MTLGICYITILILIGCSPFLFIFGVIGMHSNKLGEQVLFCILALVTLEYAAGLWYLMVNDFIQSCPDFKGYASLPITVFIIVSDIIAIIISYYIQKRKSKKRQCKEK